MWLQHQFLKFFEDCSTTIEVRPGALTKVCLYNHKSMEIWHIKFSIMDEVSYVSGERFCQDPLETYFCKQHPPGALKDNLTLYDSGFAKTFLKPKSIQVNRNR